MDAFSERLESQLPPERYEALKRLNQEGGSDTVLPIPGYGDLETLGWGADNAVMREAVAATPLRPMPLAVLAHGRPFPLPAKAQGFTAAELEALLRAHNEGLATLVPNARFSVATDSGHDIHQDQPELVIEARTTAGLWAHQHQLQVEVPDSEPSRPAALGRAARTQAG